MRCRRIEHQRVTEKFITACANGDLQALAAVLDPTVWGVGTVLADPGAATAGQPRAGRCRGQSAALPGAWRDAGERSGRAARCCWPSPSDGCSPSSC